MCVCVSKDIYQPIIVYVFLPKRFQPIPSAGTVSAGDRLIHSVQKGSKHLFCGADLGSKKVAFLVKKWNNCEETSLKIFFFQILSSRYKLGRHSCY